MVVCGQEIWKFWQQKSPQVDIAAWIFTHPMVVDSLDPNMGLFCKKKNALLYITAPNIWAL